MKINHLTASLSLGLLMAAPLAQAQMALVGGTPLLPMAAEDIRHLQAGTRHDRGLSRQDVIKDESFERALNLANDIRGHAGVARR